MWELRDRGSGSQHGLIRSTDLRPTLRTDIADAAHLDETEASAENFPHRRTYLLLVIEFLRELLELHLRLVDEVERELA